MHQFAALRWLGLLGALLAASSVSAQEHYEPPGGDLPDYARRIELGTRGAGPAVSLSTNGLPHVLVTGYWPPTNEMLREFSQNPAQNPGGWVGENWENRGYNLYAFFPEFPGGLGKGDGDFEVDYQDTSNDWWPLVDQIKPLCIVTFSRAGNDLDWEMEGGNGNYTSSLWSSDYLIPFKPTPELPSDMEAHPVQRYSTQPMDAIVAAVAAEVPTLNPFIAPFDNGRFLSNYIGYHGNWYRDLHADPCQPNVNLIAGHIHVGYAMSLAEAVDATRVTLRVVLDHLDMARIRADFNRDGAVDDFDYRVFENCLAGPDQPPSPTFIDVTPFDCLAAFDADCDTDVDLADFSSFLKPQSIP